MRGPVSSGRQESCGAILLSNLTVCTESWQEVLDVADRVFAKLDVDIRGAHKFIENKNAHVVLHLMDGAQAVIQQFYNPVPDRLFTKKQSKLDESSRRDGSRLTRPFVCSKDPFESLLNLGRRLSENLSDRSLEFAQDSTFDLLTSLILALIQPECRFAPFTPYVNRYISDPEFALAINSQVSSMWTLAIKGMAALLGKNFEELKALGVTMFNECLKPHFAAKDGPIRDRETPTDVRIFLCLAGYSQGIFSEDVLCDNYRRLPWTHELPEEPERASKSALRGFQTFLAKVWPREALNPDQDSTQTAPPICNTSFHRLIFCNSKHEKILKVGEMKAIYRTSEEESWSACLESLWQKTKAEKKIPNLWPAATRVGWNLLTKDLGPLPRLAFELSQLEDLSFWSQVLTGADVRSDFTRYSLYVDESLPMYRTFMIRGYIDLMYPKSTALSWDSRNLIKYVADLTPNQILKVALEKRLKREEVNDTKTQIDHVCCPGSLPCELQSQLLREGGSVPQCLLTTLLIDKPENRSQKDFIVQEFLVHLKKSAKRIGQINEKIYDPKICKLIQTHTKDSLALLGNLEKKDEFDDLTSLSKDVIKIVNEIAYCKFLREKAPLLKTLLLRDVEDCKFSDTLGGYTITSSGGGVVTISPK